MDAWSAVFLGALWVLLQIARRGEVLTQSYVDLEMVKSWYVGKDKIHGPLVIQHFSLLGISYKD